LILDKTIFFTDVTAHLIINGQFFFILYFAAILATST